jgi:hypothetical protein
MGVNAASTGVRARLWTDVDGLESSVGYKCCTFVSWRFNADEAAPIGVRGYTGCVIVGEDGA